LREHVITTPPMFICGLFGRLLYRDGLGRKRRKNNTWSIPISSNTRLYTCGSCRTVCLWHMSVLLNQPITAFTVPPTEGDIVQLLVACDRPW
jgi:hypothetical protein